MIIIVGKNCTLIHQGWSHNLMWALQKRNIHTSIRYPVGVYILPAEVEEKDVPFEIFLQLLDDYDCMSPIVKFLP